MSEMTGDMQDAAARAADNSADAADAATEAAKAETARHLAEGAEAATAAAEAAKALAETTAAQTVQKNESDVEWLKQHATKTENSLNELQRNQEALTVAIPSLLAEQSAKMEAMLSPLLTPPPLPESQTVTPQEESAALAAQEKTEAEKKKPKHGPKYRANWI